MGIPAIPNRRDPQFGDEKMNNNGKFASALAVFAVVACLLMAVPSVEATGDGTSAPEEIGADGFLALAQDGVLTLQKDYVLTSALAVEDELTIDLNGHSIVNSDANANHTIDVSETGKLTIEDSVGTGTVDNVTHAKAAIMNDGEVVLEGGKFTRSLESASNTYYVIDNHGTLTIHDGVTVSKTSEEQHSSMIRNADGATLTIQGGTFESGKDIAVKNDTGGVLRIYDGTFTPAKISTDFAVQNWGTATIMGGTFKGIVASMSDDENASSMTVENGTFSGKVLAWNFVDNYVSGMDPADNAASVVINGGNFSTPASNYAAIIGGTGSTFLVTDPTIASYVINGGTFGSNVSQYLADDVVLVNRDGKYVVTQDTAGSVAQVGQVYFTDLATAFKNCADSTVVLTDDITLGASVTITKNNVVVDLNGHVISGELNLGDFNLDDYRSEKREGASRKLEDRDFTRWPRVNLQLSAEHVRWNRLHLEDVHARLIGQNGSYEFNPLSGILAGSPVTASMKTVLLPTTPLSSRLSLNFSVPQANLEEISQALAERPLLKGSGAINASLAFTTSRGLPSLTGRGSLTSSQVETAFSILPPDIPLASSFLSSSRFERLFLSFFSKDGVLTVDRLTLEAARLSLSGSGTVNLEQRTVDAEGSVQIAGTSAMPVRLEGDLREPKYSLEGKKQNHTLSPRAIELDLSFSDQVRDLLK